MENMEERIGQILSDPQMMSKIMSLAQSFGAQEDVPSPSQNMPETPQIDPGMLQKIASVMGKTGIDSHQQSLLQSLMPYLSHQRISKLEKAMRAAKLAGIASSFLGSNPIFFGR